MECECMNVNVLCECAVCNASHTNILVHDINVQTFVDDIVKNKVCAGV